MKDINIWKFSFDVWLRFQLIVVGLGVALSCATFQFESIFGVFYLELINAFFSGFGCISYTLMVYFWVKIAFYKPNFQLKFILYNAGWLNVVFLFVLYLFFLIGNKAIINSFSPVAGFSILIILIGQAAIYWAARKLELADFNEVKLNDLVNELGTSPQES